MVDLVVFYLTKTIIAYILIIFVYLKQSLSLFGKKYVTKIPDMVRCQCDNTNAPRKKP